jgi:serine/threonine-protein kinase
VAILAVGSELAGYRIDQLIGRGGMGVVYRGTDLRLGRPVAIKLITADRAEEPTVRQRFEREARLMAAIDHPHVLPVYAAGEENGSLYLVMRYVGGTDLAALLREEGRLVPSHAVGITEQVAQALDAAHRAGLVHRDIKPANVLLAGDHTYLSDFGIGRVVEAATRLTDTNDWLGTVDFCSPEQLRGEHTDARSDVYSLGCLLHTALTGAPPHHRDTTPATMFAHLNEQPAPASRTSGVPAGFDAVLARALAKRPANRYASAGELALDARAALDARKGVGGAPGTDRPLASRRTRRVPRRPRPAEATRRRGETVPSPTRRLHRLARTKVDLRPDRGARADTPPERRRLNPRMLVAGILAAVLAAAALLAASLSSSGSPPGPLRQVEISGVLGSFASAYGHRDARAVASLLAPDVTRVSSGTVEHGRPAVVARYRAEFADGSIIAYHLRELQVESGWVGRAAGRYAVIRAGQANLSGGVTFGIERVDGRPRIALIAIAP